MEMNRELSRKLVRSTIAEYEQARATGDVEVMTALHEVSRAAHEVETRFEKLENAATTAMLAIVTADEAVAKELYLLALEQNKRDPDEESYVWRLHLGRRFTQTDLPSLRGELIECRALASRLGDRVPCSKQMQCWPVCRSNITLVPTRKGEAPLLVAQRRR